MKSELECESASGQKVTQKENKRKTNGAARKEENCWSEELESRV
jgi:hypothetical protein